LSKKPEILSTRPHYDLAQLYRKRNNPELAQQYYNSAHQIFQQLGATKNLEKIDREWESD